MDAEELSQGLETEQEFWDALDKIVTAEFETHEHIDDALRSFLGFAVAHKQDYMLSEYDFARYVYKLLDSKLFAAHGLYIRRQILYCLLQDDDVDTLHLAAAIFLFDGRANESAFEMMQGEGAFPRLVDLIGDRKDDDSGLHRMLLELLFEMARIQRLSREDLAFVGDDFVLYLFQLIEELADDADDPYHYPIIRVLLVLNEQYMCFANVPAEPGSSGPMTNRILKLLSMYGPSYRTFGENLILLLNRESSLGPQLLILKLLYLLFTTPPTFEYFYTNDLHVLVDVIIRNLLDLDPGSGDPDKVANGEDRDGQRALRHTYLRVLCPLLKNTQLAREEDFYKREGIRRLLHLLVNRSSAHFAPVDETVIRLVLRVKQIDWLSEEGDEEDQEMERKLAEVAPKDTEVAKKLLGMSIDDGGESSLSIDDVSAKVTKDKPSVPAPRRRRNKKAGDGAANTKGSHGNELKVPTNTATTVSGGADEGGRSPFADDSEEV